MICRISGQLKFQKTGKEIQLNGKFVFISVDLDHLCIEGILKWFNTYKIKVDENKINCNFNGYNDRVSRM